MRAQRIRLAQRSADQCDDSPNRSEADGLPVLPLLHAQLQRCDPRVVLGEPTGAHQAREAGISHVALNPKVTRRPYSEILDELGSEVLPYVGRGRGRVIREDAGGDVGAAEPEVQGAQRELERV